MASRPGRTLTSILGIAVGVATVLSVLIVDHNTILTAVLRRPSTSGRPDVEIRPLDAGTPRDRIPEALAREKGLREVRPLFRSRIRVAPPRAQDRARDVGLFALDPDAGRIYDAWRLAEGDGFLAADARDVLVPLTLARELGVDLGDPLSLQLSLPPRRECREGERVIVHAGTRGEPVTFTVAGLLEADGIGRRRGVIVPFRTGLDLYRDAHVQVTYWARLAPDVIYQDVRERLKGSFVVDKPKSALVGERVDQRAFRKSIRIAACLSLLLGLFVIYNAFSLALVERVREIGLLRALGLTGAEIAQAVLLEGAALALAGTAAGLLLSFGVVWVMVRLGITSLGWGKPIALLEVPWTPVLAVLAFGAAAALLGVVAPLLRVRRMSVVEAVRAGQIAYRPDPTRFLRALLLALLPAALLLVYVAASPPLGERQDEVFRLVAWIAFWVSLVFGGALLAPRLLQGAVVGLVRLLLAARPLERPVAVAQTRGSLHRVFGSTIGIALVLSAFLVIEATTGSLLEESGRFADRALGGRIFLRTKPLKKEHVAAAADVPGVAAFYSLSAEVHSPFPIRGVDPDAAVAHVAALRDDPARAQSFRDGRGMVLSEFLARNFDYAPGDVVRLSSYRGPVEVEVLAVDDAFGYFPDDRSFALLAADAVLRLFCVDDESGTQYVVDVDEGADAGRVRAALVARLGADEVRWARTAGEIARAYHEDMRRDFWIFRVLLLLTGTLAVVGLWNSLTVALLERRREVGLLRALGYTPGELAGMLAAESAAIGLVGGGLALLAGGRISPLVVEAIAVISRLDVRPPAPGAGFFAVPLAAAALAVLATVPPAWRLRRLVVASTTRME